MSQQWDDLPSIPDLITALARASREIELMREIDKLRNSLRYADRSLDDERWARMILERWIRVGATLGTRHHSILCPRCKRSHKYRNSAQYVHPCLDTLERSR